jgi:hypothetical protein
MTMVWMAGDFLEGLHVVNDPTSGLSGVVAIHSTALGPSAGGCRFWSYGEQHALVTDAIRLARGMSYKNALAGLPFVADVDEARAHALAAEVGGRHVGADEILGDAGGIINVCAEYLGEGVDAVETRVARIAPRLIDILGRSAALDLATNRVADDLARETIGAAQRLAA